MLNKRATQAPSQQQYDFQLLLLQFLTFVTNRSTPLASEWPPQPVLTCKRISSIARSNTREFIYQQFLDRFQRCLEATKRGLVATMESMSSQLSSVNVERLEQVVEKLKGLTAADTRQMLEVTVLECYAATMMEDVTDISETEAELYRRLRKTLKPLAQYGVTLKEYYRRTDLKKRLTNSQKHLPDTIKQPSSDAFDEQVIRQIQCQLSKKQFYQLIKQYLKSEQQKIGSIKQICRICECRINVENIAEHVHYCQNKHRLNEELAENLGRLNQLAGEIRQLEVKLQVESKGRGGRREEEENGNGGGGEEEVRTLKKYKRILKYVRDTNGQRRSNHLEERVRAIQIEEALQDILMTQDPVIDRFLQLLDSRNKILAHLKKNQCQHFITKKQRNHSQISQFSQVSATGQTFNHSALQDRNHATLPGALPLKTKKSQFSKQDRPDLDSAQPMIRRKQKKTFTTLMQPRQVENNSDEEEQVRCNSEKFLRPAGEAVSNLRFKDFQVLGFLGKGAFGKVYLVRRLLTNDRYAMKVIKIYQGLDSKKIQNIANQNDIFRKISGQHLVKAAFSFSQAGLHMFFLQYMQGGDFSQLLQNQVYLQQQTAKFYLAEIVLAIEHLHKLNIIHRDLKPQNLVLDSAGHLKLTDFGLSKEGVHTKIELTKSSGEKENIGGNKGGSVMSGMSSSGSGFFGSSNKSLRSTCSRRKTLLYHSKQRVKIIGTPDYIAPEILQRVSTDNQTIDWWSLGVIVYEVLVGEKPFGAQTIEQVFDNILNFRIEWPEIGYGDGMITPEARDLIKGLLTMKYSERLGANGVDQIKHHPFFSGINWQQIKHTKPPIQPKLTKPETVENRSLRREIESSMCKIDYEKTPEQNKLNLNNFVRLDILSECTLRSGEEARRKKEEQLKKLNQVAEKIEC